ncbi:MAG: MBL fold metallo-hydrolase [Henriciella sp.]|jgi:glyoxylase-like metal-dependent hydrolase (beta-lactamase superfamily II)|uniref:MBL fold metallo-hydrolase n=1 Tax=Henriciella sp. TaxID=1968823 RepID=UPI000C6A1307|nr:MBL fold metallo-hydrolase [Henriciella sp.]MAN73063.1 MBL fold metallo-hydrolase [Henriciella sp.]MBF34807.1 MBL fold metallo-hydrolase [Hyphomonadaceae bacterium]MBK76246.1 MBL fold metallo-hydrolase [Henriciella sp.]|tara:strand:+ start:1299 stop:2165 length:867 start_codon:yes stop_codon:yes gene_type:complete
MNTPTVQGFFDDTTNTISYVVWDPATEKAAVIDALLDFDQASGRTKTDSADRLIAFVREKGLEVEWVIDTHVHADHLTATPYVREQLGGQTGIGEHIATVQKVFGEIFNEGQAFHTDGSQFDHLFKDGETYRLGSIEAKAIHTPGHTPACMSHVIGDAVFVGDTIFMPDFGTARCDFPGGDAGTLYDSIQKLFALPDETRIFLCHDYKAPGRDDYVWETTIGEEKHSNKHVKQGTSREDFVKMRTERDATLSMPKLILPSVQINMRAGEMPPAEPNGKIYMKLPINAL